MPWTDTARDQHNRDYLRYPSDLTDREWALIGPMLPAAKRGGRPRTTNLRDVIDAIQFVASSGCQWRMLPKDFPPVSTVRGYFYAWRNQGLWYAINHLLVAATRELEGRAASPTAGVLDSQSVKTTEAGGVCGYDAGKKTKGRKRHMLTDTIGLMLVLIIQNAGVQDRPSRGCAPQTAAGQRMVRPRCCVSPGSAFPGCVMSLPSEGMVVRSSGTC